MTDIACPSCGTANPPSNRFCGSCGSTLTRTCPSCGTENPPTNRYCGSCGTALEGVVGPAAAAVVEERKVVTVLIADLTASTEMASRLDPEDLRAVLRPFFDAMVEEIDRYGGTVEKFIGDAIVAVFGAPVAHEDDPERAIRCALAMHRRLEDLNHELASRAGADLAMRIGINTGEVVTHSIEEGIATGEAVNVAARFQALAEPGSVVVGERTYRDARRSFAFVDLGEVAVKGIGRPLHVWRVDREIRGARAVPTPFVGRASELGLIRLLFERSVTEGRPNLATIVGPPGIGKSRLSHEIESMVGVDGVRVVRGRCLPYGDGLTYWPLAEILKADAGIMDSDSPEQIHAKARAALDPRFPGDEGLGVTGVLLSSIGVEVASDPLAGTDPQAARRVIFQAWQRYLESMTAAGPVLALIEDIHWADPSLLELIETVISRASGPVLVLCMTRPELFERRPDWGGGLANATTITLSPLSPGDGASLIEHLLGGPGPRDVVDAILRRSEGNPFFAGELLRMMTEDGTLAKRNGSWALVRELPSALPDTVQGVIASRIDLLAPAEKRAIQDASVVGRVFWPAAIARLGTPDAERAVDALVAKGLAAERDNTSIAGEREVIFNHVLTRDVAYASIPRARRADAHAAIGAWVEEVTTGRHEEFSEILAYHFELAGDRSKTGRYALLAGNRHLRVFASDQAAEWYDRAIEAAKDDSATRGRALLARGGAHELVGRFSEALEDYIAAQACAEEIADAELEARALAARAHVLWLLDRYDEAGELLPTALERARAVGLGDVEVRLLYTAGTVRFGRGEFADALPLHEQALAVAEASGDLEGQALAHHGLCETHFFHGPFERALAHGETADRMLRELGQRSMVAHNAYMVAWSLGFVGRIDEAFAVVDGSIATSREIGNRREEAFALYDRAELLLTRGRLDEAWREAEDGRAIFAELGAPRGELVGWNVLSDVALETGRADLLRASARAALEASDRVPGTFQRSLALAAVGAAAAWEGDAATAAARFGEARALDGALLDVAWSARTEVLALERSDDVAALRDIASRIRERVLPASTFWGGWAPYAEALASLLEERFEDALERAREATETAAAVGERRLRWRAERLAWRAAEALGRADEAERHRAEAASIVADAASSASGALGEGFVARADVAELLT